MTIPISTGSGAASVAAEVVSGVQYQQVEVLGKGGGSTLGVNPDGSLNSSIIGVPTFNAAGSVVAFQGGSPWAHTNVGSIITIQIGSVITTQIGSVITVWKDSSVLSNATITSIAVANGGLPIWSPLGSRIQGTADLRVVQGGSVAVIAAQGSGVFTYIDHVQILNFGSSSVLVTIADVTTSILGYTIAPAGGGSNYDTFYKTAANNPITASLNGTASVLVSMQGFKSAT